MRLPNKATTARRRPVFVIKSSEWSAARPAFKGGSRRQRWAAPSCMLALLAWHSCIVAAAKRMSAALGRARSAPSHRAWHACMMDLYFIRLERIFCRISWCCTGVSVIASSVRVGDQDGRWGQNCRFFEHSVIVTPSSHRSRHPAWLREFRFSFAFVREKAWSKVNWILHQVNL